MSGDYDLNLHENAKLPSSKRIAELSDQLLIIRKELLKMSHWNAGVNDLTDTLTDARQSVDHARTCLSEAVQMINQAKK